MAYLSTAVANDFLDLAEHDRCPLTQMQVQKLVYFGHGWNLALNGEPLSIERFEAWDYGPVVRRLWEHLRRFGSKPVEGRIADYVMIGGKFTTAVSRIASSPDTSDKAASMDIVRTVWEKYGHFTAIQLSELTHLPDGPWAAARKAKLPFIDDSAIGEYFLKLKAG